MEQVHGTCIEVDGVGVLLLGPSGSGKSDLALRLIDGGARLVADDRADLNVRDGTIVVSAPAPIAGLLEVRGVGVLKVECAAESRLGLVADLSGGRPAVRLPDPEEAWRRLGVAVALIRLDPFAASAPAKVRLAVRRVKGDIMPAP